MVNYRSFRNDDPPHLVAIWNESFTGRGCARVRHATLLERGVFSKSYFDPRGLIVAEENGKRLGFVHAGFGPNQRESQLSKAVGVICLIGVRPANRRKGIGTELLRRAEAYLKERGAQTVTAGMARPVSPFYFGLYGGSDLPGFLDSDLTVAPFLQARGYQKWESAQVYQRPLDQQVEVADARFSALRKRFDIRILPRIPVTTWWQECVLGLIEPVEFRLEEKGSNKSVARTVAWEMEAFSSTWNQPSVGLIDITVREELRRQGLGKFLLAQILRYLQDQYFGLVEMHALEVNKPALQLFGKLGFERVDVGWTYRKTS